MPNTPPREGASRFDIQSAVIDQSEWHYNVAQEFVATTADKIRLCLRDHQASLKAQDNWMAPAGILATLVATLVTAAEFRPAFGLSADVWRAAYWICTLASAVWLVHSIKRAIDLRGNTSVEAIVQRIKQGQL